MPAFNRKPARNSSDRRGNCARRKDCRRGSGPRGGAPQCPLFSAKDAHAFCPTCRSFPRRQQESMAWEPSESWEVFSVPGSIVGVLEASGIATTRRRVGGGQLRLPRGSGLPTLRFRCILTNSITHELEAPLRGPEVRSPWAFFPGDSPVLPSGQCPAQLTKSWVLGIPAPHRT